MLAMLALLHLAIVSAAAPIIGGWGGFRYQYDPTRMLLPAGSQVLNAHGLVADFYEKRTFRIHEHHSSSRDENGNESHSTTYSSSTDIKILLRLFLWSARAAQAAPQKAPVQERHEPSMSLKARPQKSPRNAEWQPKPRRPGAVQASY